MFVATKTPKAPAQIGQPSRPFVTIGFHWEDVNRTQGFATWADEIAHMESLGYELVPPDHQIPHWSQAEGARKLYVNGRDGPREMTACFDRPARDLGYPLFFRQILS